MPRARPRGRPSSLTSSRLAGVRMERAAGIRAGIQQGAQLVGAPLGGVLVAALGATAALWIDAASFLVSAGLVLLLVPRPHRDASSEARGRFLAELADGLRFIWRQPARSCRRRHGAADQPHRGAAVGRARRLRARGVRQRRGLRPPRRRPRRRRARRRARIQRVGHRLPRRKTFLVCFSGVPIGYLVLAAQPSLPVALAALALAGFAAGPINPLLFTVQTEIVPGRAPGPGLRRDSCRLPGPRSRSGSCSAASLVAAIGAPATFLVMGVLARGRRRLRVLQSGRSARWTHSGQRGARADEQASPA